MNWNEGVIAAAIARQTLAKKCVVLVDRCNWTGHECDVLGVTTDLRIIDVEIKISRADLKADAKKDKWWHRQYLGRAQPEKTPNGVIYRGIWEEHRREWPPRVWKHYYALPAEIWSPELFAALPSPASGVLLLSDDGERSRQSVIVECIRRATPNRSVDRLTGEQVMNIARLANLRMWEAYKKRDEARMAAETHGVAA